MRRSSQGEQYELSGTLWRGAERMELTTPHVVHDAGILFTRDVAAQYAPLGAFKWIALLRERGPVQIPAAQSEEFLVEMR